MRYLFSDSIIDPDDSKRKRNSRSQNVNRNIVLYFKKLGTGNLHVLVEFKTMAGDSLQLLFDDCPTLMYT